MVIDKQNSSVDRLITKKTNYVQFTTKENCNELISRLRKNHFVLTGRLIGKEVWENHMTNEQFIIEKE